MNKLLFHFCVFISMVLKGYDDVFEDGRYR